MMDTTDRANLKQLSAVSFGKDAGPHNLVLSSDDNRLMVSDYFLNEDAAGKLGAGTAALDVWLGHRGGLRRILRRSQFTSFRSPGVELSSNLGSDLHTRGPNLAAYFVVLEDTPDLICVKRKTYSRAVGSQ